MFASRTGCKECKEDALTEARVCAEATRTRACKATSLASSCLARSLFPLMSCDSHLLFQFSPSVPVFQVPLYLLHVLVCLLRGCALSVRVCACVCACACERDRRIPALDGAVSRRHAARNPKP
eukprot:3363356-Rhodomonas_salina.2